MLSTACDKLKIPFLSTRNACRSQMAQGWARHLHSEAVVIHRGFDDPPKLAAKATDEHEAMYHYRRVRDEIRAFVQDLPTSLQKPETQ